MFLTNRRFAVAVLLAALAVPHAVAQQNASRATAAAQSQAVNDLQLQINAVVLQQSMNAAQLPLPANMQLQPSGAPQSVLQRQLAVVQQQLSFVGRQGQQLRSLRQQAFGAEQQPLTLLQAAQVQSLQQKVFTAQMQNALLQQQLTVLQQQLQTALQQTAP
jgi:hypothetical protein